MAEWIGETRMRFGHAFDSEALNSESRRMYEELKQAYERVANLESELFSTKEEHELEVRAMSASMIKLEAALNWVEEQLDALGESSGRKTLFTGDMTPGDEKSATIYTEESVVGVNPRRRINKLVMISPEGESILPEKVKVKVGRTNNGGEVKDVNDRSMLEGKGAWRREVIYDAVSAPVKEDAIYEASLPLLFSGDRMINEVIVHPFPVASSVVESVQLLVAGTWVDVAWSRPPQQPTESKDPIRLRFKPSLAEAVRVRVVQETKKLRGAKAIFTLGIERLEVSHCLYQEEERCVLAEATMSGVYGITRIEPIFQHPIAARQFRTELYRKRDDVLLPIDPGTWHTLSDEKVWVKVWIKPDASTGVSPTLQAVRVHTRKS